MTATVVDQAPASVVASEQGARLLTRTGSTVGTIEPSKAGDERVVVMQISDAPPGRHYSCRLVLKDGTVRDAGAWWVPASGRATWIAYGTASTIDRVELVADDGSVWSTPDRNGDAYPRRRPACPDCQRPSSPARSAGRDPRPCFRTSAVRP